jgi:hypothetical protein
MPGLRALDKLYAGYTIPHIEKEFLSRRTDETFAPSTLVSTVTIRPGVPAWLLEDPWKAAGRTGEHIPG